MQEMAFLSPKMWKIFWGSMLPHTTSLQYLLKSNLSFYAYTFKISRYAPDQPHFMDTGLPVH